MLTVTDKWEAAYPGASVGVLAMRDVVNEFGEKESAPIVSGLFGDRVWRERVGADSVRSECRATQRIGA